MIDKLLYLNKNEWWIIVRKAGIERTIAFEELGSPEIDDIQTANAFISLTSRGLIEGEKNAFKISDQLCPYIKSLKSAKYVMTERRYLDIYPVSCLYIGSENVLRVEMDKGNSMRLSLRVSSIDSLAEEETGYGFMPDKDSVLPTEYEDYFADTSAWEKAFGRDSNLLLYYRVYDTKKCKLVWKVYVKRESLCDIIVSESAEGKQETMGYSKQFLSDFFRKPVYS